MASRAGTDLEFFRKFTQLVEANYKEKHNVADYADMLLLAPKTLTHRFKRLSLPQPNDIMRQSGCWYTPTGRQRRLPMAWAITIPPTSAGYFL
jgi:hypothetical protein